MTPNGLGLDTASKTQGAKIIPANTQVELVMQIRPGNVGLEGLLKRSSKGDSEYLDVKFTVRGGPFDKHDIYSNMLLDGVTAGHAKAGERSRTTLRAIFESVHGIDPDDNSPATMTRRANATLAEFSGATFLATVGIEKGDKKPDGSFYKDKNIVDKVLRVGDPGYRKLDQPPPAPIERATPPTASNGPPAMAATTAIAKPAWAE